ncbi:unnamed protein product [Bursaphelenchus xylophilus]|uniref:(pine wood nematode) hypothetical protein n=1 Tax=Bursaphelenchus xylophilus TaxID=6326 RepID=A0A1I7S1K5_BURXY|nr:unnamed protein product [Bursaphelenchus xylophilus]CAG9081343.1 unnamed protein product [Bursaphelenchus xylophilus]
MKIDVASSRSFQLCSVCNSPWASAHFGVITCRSCAAFFRRSIVLGRNYRCKRKGDCDVITDSRTSCAGCRLRKCIKVGMEVEKIRPNFDRNGPRRKEKPVSLKAPPVLTAQQPSTSSYLTQMVEGYRIFLEDTKTLYFVFHPEHVFTQEIVFQKLTAKEHTFMDRTAIAYYVKMLNGHFFPFKDLNIKEKKSVLDIFHFRFSFLNEQYLNTVYFLNDEGKQFFHYGAYIEINSPEHLYTPQRFLPDIERTFSPLISKMSRIAKKFRTHRPDDTEIAGLIGIILLREISAQFPDRGCDRILEQIQEELADYCRRTHPQDPCRMGRIICLLRGLEEICLMLTENLTIGMIINADGISIRNTDLFKT